MKILITGGAGYIGSVITKLALQEGHKIKIVDLLWFEKEIPLLYIENPNYEFIRGNICDVDLMNKILKDVDFIVHTAAVVGEPASKKFPELTYKINYKASINLINIARENGIKGFILFSTCSNYGISKGTATENVALMPLSLYAKTKVNVERYLINEVKKINWIVCRLATAYGVSPRMRFDLIVNDFTMNSYVKKYLDIFLPFSRRPYIHVFDIAKIVMKMLKSFQTVKNNIFNIGFNGENYQKIQIAGIVKKFMPETEIAINKTGADLRDYQVDFSKLKRYLGIKNIYNVEDGIKEVLKLLRERIITNPFENRYYNTMPDLGRELIADKQKS